MLNFFLQVHVYAGKSVLSRPGTSQVLILVIESIQLMDYSGIWMVD